MANQCITDIISVTEKRIDTSFEMGIDQEILLADYDKPVFKIVKTIAEHSVTQKYINGNRLIIEGFFRISVFYQPPAGDVLTVVSKKQTFQKQLDLQVPVTDAHFIDISGEVQYINTRAINPTRIVVNGVYSFDVGLYTAENTSVTTAINSNSVCIDTREISFFSLLGRGTRQFSVEDELSIGENTDKVLHISAWPVNVGALCYEDKVNIKGELVAEIVYTQADSDLLHTVKKKFPFNQITDIQGIGENNVAYPQMHIISTTVTANQQTGKINCIITATADVKVFGKNTVICVADGFSKKYTAEKQCRNVQYHKNIFAVDKTAIFSMEDTVGGGYSPVYSFVNISNPFIAVTDGTHSLKATVHASVLAINSQKEYEGFTKTVDITIDTAREIFSDDKYFVDCIVADKSLSIADGVLKLDFTLNLKGFVLNTQTEKILETFGENTAQPNTNRQNSLILYYGTKGERIFDIAMKYNTDTGLIMAENNLPTHCLDSDKMLIIPSFEV